MRCLASARRSSSALIQESDSSRARELAARSASCLAGTSESGHSVIGFGHRASTTLIESCGAAIADGANIWIDGGRVNGHYKYKDPIKYPESTHGALNFRAYLTYFGPSFSFVTSAHESRRFRIPS
jgi:hypothetical protein